MFYSSVIKFRKLGTIYSPLHRCELNFLIRSFPLGDERRCQIRFFRLGLGLSVFVACFVVEGSVILSYVCLGPNIVIASGSCWRMSTIDTDDQMLKGSRWRLWHCVIYLQTSRRQQGPVENTSTSPKSTTKSFEWHSCQTTAMNDTTHKTDPRKVTFVRCRRRTAQRKVNWITSCEQFRLWAPMAWLKRRGRCNTDWQTVPNAIVNGVCG